MRPWTAALALMLLPAASAQEHAGCSQEEPCIWVVDMDADGFWENTVDGAVYNGTAGDWYAFNITNFDDRSHTVRFDGYDMQWTIASVDSVESQPFLLDKDGTFDLIDEETDDRATVNVFLEDVVDVEQGGSGTQTTSGPGEDSPGLGFLAVAGLLALAVLRRR